MSNCWPVYKENAHTITPYVCIRALRLESLVRYRSATYQAALGSDELDGVGKHRLNQTAPPTHTRSKGDTRVLFAQVEKREIGHSKGSPRPTRALACAVSNLLLQLAGPHFSTSGEGLGAGRAPAMPAEVAVQPAVNDRVPVHAHARRRELESAKSCSMISQTTSACCYLRLTTSAAHAPSYACTQSSHRPICRPGVSPHRRRRPCR